ncbi:Bestrophin, RFP-TM, chloride channel-domain-containing protein [Mycena floridula]|nr:Bestrophin, RFP-TM, chloride channel-domain-containing protein [Mycena floridula]
MTGNQKSSLLASVLPSLKPPRIRRKHLRKYSWLPDVFRVKNSIIYRIFYPVLTVTLFATLVSVANDKGHNIKLTNSVVPLLSVVVGLILVFRNGTSYDRYWEGRKSFAALTTGCRNFSRMVWINVAPPPTDDPPVHAKGKTPISELNATQLQRRKMDALHLSVAFVYSVKHYLRGEDGLKWDDFNGLLPAWFTPGGHLSHSYAATRDTSVAPSIDENWGTRVTSEGTVRADATKRIRVKRSKRQLADHSTPLLNDNHHAVHFHEEASMPLPLIIAHELNRIIFHFRREGLLETVGPAGANAMSQIIQSMVDQLTAMERVANTPIPISYGIHLKQCVTLYLFALPMTLVHELGWMTVPITTVVAFTLMGIEGIADEIEMPFGEDPGDLPLDRYCEDLREEIEYTIERLQEGGEGGHGYDDGEGDD